MLVRTLIAAALAAAALAPAAPSAAAACEFGPQIGTACLRDPSDLLLDTACPILEGQTVFGIKCVPHDATH